MDRGTYDQYNERESEENQQVYEMYDELLAIVQAGHPESEAESSVMETRGESPLGDSSEESEDEQEL